VIDDVTGVRMNSLKPRPHRVLKLLKRFAERHGVAVVVSTTVLRGVESRKDRHPSIADIAPIVGNHCDEFLLLYRDEAYGRNSAKKGIIEVGYVVQGQRKP